MVYFLIMLEILNFLLGFLGSSGFPNKTLYSVLWRFWIELEHMEVQKSLK